MWKYNFAFRNEWCIEFSNDRTIIKARSRERIFHHSLQVSRITKVFLLTHFSVADDESFNKTRWDRERERQWNQHTIDRASKGSAQNIFYVTTTTIFHRAINVLVSCVVNPVFSVNTLSFLNGKKKNSFFGYFFSFLSTEMKQRSRAEEELLCLIHEKNAIMKYFFM